MKKLVCCIMVAIMCVSALAACGGPADANMAKPSNSKTESKAESKTVEIVYPASLFEGEDMASFDPAKYCEETGFSSAVVNEDGTVTVTMTEEKHNEIISEVTKSLDDTFTEFVNGEATPYIKEINYTEDFSKVTIKVAREEYEKALDFTVLAIGLSVPIAQMSVGFDVRVEISVVDVETNEIISETVYPDVLGGE